MDCVDVRVCCMCVQVQLWMYQSHRPREEKSKAEYNKGKIGEKEESIEDACDHLPFSVLRLCLILLLDLFRHRRCELFHGVPGSFPVRHTRRRDATSLANQTHLWTSFKTQVCLTLKSKSRTVIGWPHFKMVPIGQISEHIRFRGRNHLLRLGSRIHHRSNIRLGGGESVGTILKVQCIHEQYLCEVIHCELKKKNEKKILILAC